MKNMLARTVGLGLIAMMWMVCSTNKDPVYKYYAYVVNRDSANVSAYAIDAATGGLTEVTGSPFAAGDAPNSVAVDPSGKFAYVVNLAGPNNISAYTINATTGVLTAITGSPFAAGDAPNGVTTVRVEQ